MADSPFVAVLLDYRGTSFEERTRKSGKNHVTVSVQSTPIAVHLDPVALGRPVAAAIAKAIADGIRGIREKASAATILKRKYAETAFAKGKGWALKRYAGGRTGAKPPGRRDELFNDSDRLAGGIVAMPNPKEQAFTINVTANRFDRSTFDDASFTRMLNRLYQLVPALQRPLEQPAVIDAVNETWANMHVKGELAAAEKQSASTVKLMLELLRLAEKVLT